MKVYNPNVNVYEAAVERIDFVFKNFKRIYVSFSGGKDSGVMLNLCIDYMRKNNIKEKIGVMILDNEANYLDSLNFMEIILDKNLDILDVYWCCLPITLPCTTSSYQKDWQCWGNKDKDKWIRPIPKKDYVVTFENNNFDFFRENMNYDEFWDGFAKWYSKGELTAKLIGIRADESLRRYLAIISEGKPKYKDKIFTTGTFKNIYNVYPIYDWKTKDIWIANSLFDWDYNKLYDKFYLAGLPVGNMRVASPFMSESKSSLNIYRIIDSEAWSKLCLRVNGANFIATYGKQLNYSDFKLPPNHNWKSFTKFLISTLPKETQRIYIDRFKQSIIHWYRDGKGVPKNVVDELEKHGFDIKQTGISNYGKSQMPKIAVRCVPDDLDCLSSYSQNIINWKRFAITILKNDHNCKYLGFGETKKQQERKKEIKLKYSKL